MIFFYISSHESKVEASHRSLQVWEEAELDETRAGVLTGSTIKAQEQREKKEGRSGE